MQEREGNVGLIVLRTKDLPLDEMTWRPGSSTYRSHLTESSSCFRGEWEKQQTLALTVLITSLIIPRVTTAIMLTPSNATGIVLGIEHTNPWLEVLKG